MVAPRVSDGRVARNTQVSPETVDRWRVALSQALESGGLSEATRVTLLELREMLSLSDESGPGSGS